MSMTETHTDNLMEELLSKDLPCESPEGHCDSNHSQPATWIGYHHTSTGSCSQVLCQACVNEILKLTRNRGARLIEKIIRDGILMCHKCNETGIKIDDIQLRKI